MFFFECHRLPFLVGIAVLLISGCGRSMYPIPPHVRVELYEASLTPKEGWKRMDEPTSGTIFYLSRAPIVDQRDFAGVVATPRFSGDRHASVELRLSEAGAKKLGEATQKLIGQRIALMVNGLPAMVPVLHTAIFNDIAISFGGTPEKARSDAEAMIAVLSGRRVPPKSEP